MEVGIRTRWNNVRENIKSFGLSPDDAQFWKGTENQQQLVNLENMNQCICVCACMHQSEIITGKQTRAETNNMNIIRTE